MAASDYAYVCSEADPTGAPLCNTTALQSSLSTKVCLYTAYPADYNPYTFYCSSVVYDAWINACPKKNFNLEGFCGGNSYYPYPCFLQPCTTDADCPVITPVAPAPVVTPSIACYDCCFQCHDADYCNTAVSNGVYAAPGNTSCISCTATTPASPPVCVGGVAESTGYCNCYSGFMNDIADPGQLCSVPPPNYCQPLNQTTPMENYVVPYIYNLHVSRNKLGLNVNSAFVANRTTLIEFPNPECNLINNPSFYSKTFDACYDDFSVDVPFATCGFTKSSNVDQDLYRGEMHVKHIDRIEIDGQIVERVIDTPFTIVIRLPRNLAVQSSVEIDAAPIFSLSVKAAFVGQTVNVATQTGQLEFVTSVPAPLMVTEARISDTPYGVNASIRFAGSNCSQTGSCLQRLVVDLNVHNCDISGVYRMFVTVACSAQKNCPSELQNTTASTYLTATIVAQPTCGEAYVDVGLQGSLQAYKDQTFTSQTLSFAAGEPAYFLIGATSDQVDISNVKIDAIYYEGGPVLGQFLFVNDSITYLGAVNNFQWGQHSSSQAWFSFDVTVSPPDVNDNSLFKLNNGESDVYNFVAMVEVEWTPDSATPNALPSPSASPSNATNPFPFKKRIAVQGTLTRQGSQFSSQVQIERAKTQDEGSVSVSSVVTGSILAVSFALLVILL